MPKGKAEESRSGQMGFLPAEAAGMPAPRPPLVAKTPPLWYTPCAMLESQPPRTPGVRLGYLLVLLLLLIDALLLFALRALPISIFSFLIGLLLLASLPALALILYWTSGLRNAFYHVEDGALIILWGSVRQVIPLAMVTGLQQGNGAGELRRFRGIRWPGLRVGSAVLETADGPLPARVFAARGPAEQLLVTTAERAYVISPDDREIFTDALEALMRSTLPRVPRVPGTALGFWGWPLWRRRDVLGLLGGAVGLNLLLFGLLTTLYSRLPNPTPLHFDAAGAVDRWGTPSGLFVLPVAGFSAWVINGVVGALFYRQAQNRPVAFVIWGAALLLQVATWIILIGLIR